MSYNNQNIQPVTYPTNIQTPTVLGRIAKRLIAKWPFFLISLLIALACAYTYLKYVKTVYEMKATLVIKDKDKTDENKTDLQELDLANPGKKVAIEVKVLKSRRLITKVINDLNIWADYVNVSSSKKEPLYKSTPIIYQAIGAVPVGKSQLNIKIIDQNSFQITQKDGKKEIIPFNKTFKSTCGLSLIRPTQNVNQYLGSTINIALQDTEAVINHYENIYESRLVDKEQPIIELVINDVDPLRGKDFLNYIIAEYNNNNTEEKDKLTENTLKFIDKRLDSLSGELSHVEKNIEGYKSSRGITDISSQSVAYLQSMQSNDTRLNDVNVQLRIINGIEKYVNSPGNNNVPATIGIEDKGLSDLVDQLAKLQLERTRLLATTPETNYLFDPIKRQIQSTVAAIKENVKNIKSSLLNIKAGLESVNSSVESSIKDLPGEERGYISIKRQQSIKEELYTYLLQKREQVALSYAATLTDVNVIDRAYVSDVVWPKKPLAYALAIIIALGLTATIIFLMDYVDNTEEIENALDTHVLGELVKIKAKSPLVVLDPENKKITQQFRALRTSLHYLHNNKEHGRVILVSSSKSGEGKSFVATNLGLSIASSGRKTIIIDMDLHKPNIAGIFNFNDNQPGINNYLKGEASIEEIIRPSNIYDNLFVITSGYNISNPSELIESPHLDGLINLLKENYDDIILDTPPLRLVTDVYILSQYCDVSLYIIRKGYTKNTELNFVKKLYQEQRLPNLNIVFNGAKKTADNYGY